MPDTHTPHKEPEEVFLPLSPSRYAEFYSLEMDGFSQDILFYQNSISENSKTLELGCGTGRISRAISMTGRSVIGLDLSAEMLRLAHQYPESTAEYICMDMCNMAFTKAFDHIIIPYNTLNLLKTETQILKCLNLAHRFLKPDGTLLFQVYIPGTTLTKPEDEKVFQFEIFLLPENNGKLIKECIRSFSPATESICLEERYRYRPVDGYKKDFSHYLTLAGFSYKHWIKLLQLTNFEIISTSGKYDGSPFDKDNDSLLLVKTKHK